MEKQANKQLGTRFRHIRWLVILPLAFILFTQKYWWPCVEDWRCGWIAAKLRSQYGLVVRFGDPSDFYLQPLPPVTDSPGMDLSIEPAEPHAALTALQGIRRALSKYPEDLVLEYLEAVFIAGPVKNNGIQIGGTYFHSWIYVSAIPDWDSLGVSVYEKSLHHEFSSILMDSAEFPCEKWCDANNPNFEYKKKMIDGVRASVPENFGASGNATLWFEAGFVDDYGMTGLENDVNTYAALAMTRPAVLKQLMTQYPIIKAKTEILVKFYSRLAPELEAYFSNTGLTESNSGPGLRIGNRASRRLNSVDAWPTSHKGATVKSWKS